MVSRIATRWAKLLLTPENSVNIGSEDRSTPSSAAVVALLK